MKAKKFYRNLAQDMIWSLVTFISLLTYIVEVRPFFVSLLGIYFAGLSDGILGTVIMLTMIFYLASRNPDGKKMAR